MNVKAAQARHERDVPDLRHGDVQLGADGSVRQDAARTGRGRARLRSCWRSAAARWWRCRWPASPSMSGAAAASSRWRASATCAALPLLALPLNARVLLAATLFVFGAALGAMDVAMNAQAHRRAARGGPADHVRLSRALQRRRHRRRRAASACCCAPVSASAACAAVIAAVLARPRVRRSSGISSPTIGAADGGYVHHRAEAGGARCSARCASCRFSAKGRCSTGARCSSGAAAGRRVARRASATRRSRSRWPSAGSTGDAHHPPRSVRAACCGSAARSPRRLSSPWRSSLGPSRALAGFVIVGIGAANIVPVLFSGAGRVPGVPPGIALATVTTIAYAGLLLGPGADRLRRRRDQPASSPSCWSRRCSRR